jgi:DNA-binding transcriptional LysR family regulator
MVDINSIAIFAKVVEAGSFTGAARQLNLPKSAVSRKVALLEDELNTRLLQRTTRKLFLTDTGEQYYEICRKALADIDEANMLVTQAQTEPSGIIRIVAPVDFAGNYFQNWIKQFLLKYPKTRIELTLSDRAVDMVDRRIDLAFKIGELKDSTMIARKLGVSRRVFCASNRYLKKAGIPRTPSDIRMHDCIVFGPSIEHNTWSFHTPDGVERIAVHGRISADNMRLIIQAALAGLGIAHVPLAPIINDIKKGRLRTVLDEYCGPVGGIYAVFPSNRHLSKIVRAFLDHIIAQTSYTSHWDLPDGFVEEPDA